MTSDADVDKKDPKQDKKLLVKVHNEDDGENFEFEANANQKLEHVIKELYKQLRRERAAEDRLRCEDGAEDVFGLAELKFSQYIDEGHCPKLEWLWSGDTGGA